MPPRAPAPCFHELRPGTKVCLHCRRAAREARAAHRNRIFVRITLAAIGIGVATAGVRAGVDAFKRGSLSRIPLLMAATTKALAESLPGEPAAPAPASLKPAPEPAAPDSGLAVTAPDSGLIVPVTPDSSPATAPRTLAPLVPIVAEGRTELASGIFAMRSGDTVTVNFDTPEARTRRPDKFEQIVRATLPMIHGSAADSLLASVAPGALIGAADLVNDLPTRGLHLRASDGRALSLWPEIRPGRDGPLIVAYRATLPR